MVSSKAVKEPESKISESSRPVYPYCNATVTEAGHTFIMDDRQGAETIKLQNGKSKSFIELHPEGHLVERIYGDGYEINLKDKKVTVDKNYTLVVKEDLSVKVGGNYYLEVAGDYVESVSGDIMKLSDDDMKASHHTTKGSHNISATEDIVLNVQSMIGEDGKVVINGNLQVNGDINASGINATGSITAGLDVYGKAGLKTPGILGVGKFSALPAVPIPIPMVLIEALLIEEIVEAAHNETIGGAFSMETGGAINMVAGGLVGIEAGGAVNMSAGAAVTIEAAAAVTITAGAIMALTGTLINLN